MKKRIISVLLTLALLLTALGTGAVGASAAADTATVNIGGQSYTVKVGDYFTYQMTFDYAGEKLATAQIELPVDLTGLNGYTQAEADKYIKKIAPATSDNAVVQRFDSANSFGMTGYVMNFVSPGGISFSKPQVVLSLIFGVEKAGTYSLAARVRHVEDSNGKTVVSGNYVRKDAAFRVTESFSDATLDTPVLKVATNAGGMRVSWEPVPRAAKYRVYVKRNGSWTRILDTTDTSMLDTEVVSGTRYTYTVRCIAADASRFMSDYDRDGESAVYYTAPVLSFAVMSNGVRVTWAAVPQASKYRLYYKNNGAWTAFPDTAATSYTDTAIKPGETRTYTMRALDGNGRHLSYFYPDGFTVTRLSTPSVSLSNAADGVKISWAKIAGAEKYRVFVYGAKGWVLLADTAETSYLDQNVVSNQSYTYTVRCITADGKTYTSYYPSGTSIKYYAAPKLTLSNAADGVTVKWSATAGASKYRLYYKNNGAWTKITDTAATAYTDTSVKSGETRTYTMRAMDSKGSHLSWFYPEGFTITHQSAPTFTVSTGAGGMKISWNKVTGAEKYRVFVYGDKGWVVLADTAETSYLDKNVVSGRSYTYTVRCVKADSSAYTSAYRAGRSAAYYAAPVLSLSSTASGVRISWDKTEGASKYRLYYKSGSSWKMIADTTAASYTDTSVKPGETRTYTMRALDSNGAHLSYFYPDGFTITYTR